MLLWLGRQDVGGGPVLSTETLRTAGTLRVVSWGKRMKKDYSPCSF